MLGDWKQEAKDMGFERAPQMSKSGLQAFKFLNEGKVVPARQTGFKEDSVVFLVEQNNEKRELWVSKIHPLLRELADKGILTGHTISIDFTGTGLDMRTEVKEYQ